MSSKVRETCYSLWTDDDVGIPYCVKMYWAKGAATVGLQRERERSRRWGWDREYWLLEHKIDSGVNTGD